MEVEAVNVELEDVGAAGDAGGEEGGGEGAWGDGGLALDDAGPGQVGVEEGQEVGAVLDDEAVGAGDEEGVEGVDGAAVVGAEVDEVEAVGDEAIRRAGEGEEGAEDGREPPIATVVGDAGDEDVRLPEAEEEGPEVLVLRLLRGRLRLGGSYHITTGAPSRFRAALSSSRTSNTR